MVSSQPPSSSPERWPRRRLLKLLAAAGLGNALFGRALAALTAGQAPPQVTARMIARAAWIAGIPLSEDEQVQMLEGVRELLDHYRRNRAVQLANHQPPGLWFRPVAATLGPGTQGEAVRAPDTREQILDHDAEDAVEPDEIVLSDGSVPPPPATDDNLAFAPVTRLAGLLRSRQISSVELTRLYLDRLERYGPRLECVISLLRRPALEQAAQADREIAAGRYRGPLHGVPWGVKDLLSVPGTRTTWGAMPYRRQAFAAKATVVRRLEDAGAVLLAKLALGVLAMGEVWFGGTTRNPWSPEQGSGGSSSGPAAATSAGLVGFAIGTETYGSIITPCTRCGVTGLRPTFGRVSRHGAMTLAWSMDKIGPIARSVEDCALVFHAIQGADELDPAAVDGPLTWPWTHDLRKLRVGYTAALFDEDRTAGVESSARKLRDRQREWQAIDLRTLDELRALGIELVPISLPRAYPVEPLELILAAEVACVFDALTRGGRDQQLVPQAVGVWPEWLREGQTIPAVEYLRANRIRTLVIREMAKLMADVDLYVSPTFRGDDLLRTNLTGHPCVVVPNGFTSDGMPTSITFTGRLHGESALLAVAHAYQQTTDYHLKRPPMALSG